MAFSPKFKATIDLELEIYVITNVDTGRVVRAEPLSNWGTSEVNDLVPGLHETRAWGLVEVVGKRRFEPIDDEM